MNDKIFCFLVGLLLGLFEVSAIAVVHDDLKKRVATLESRVYALLGLTIRSIKDRESF
jgi:hypothetical protein